jgi:hypothetical protein
VRSRLGSQIRLVDERFGERRITFANAPRASAEFVSSGPLRANAWKAVDVTSLVEGAGHYVGFVLTTPSARGAEFSSRETGLHGPRLVVERQDSGPTGTGTTSTEAVEPD